VPEFRRPRGHHQLAIAAVRDPFVRAESEHRFPSLAAGLCLERIGCVVQSGVNDAAVVTALVGGETVFGLEEYYRPAGAVGQRQRRGQANQPAAGHDDVMRRGHQAPPGRKTDVIM